MNSKNKFRIWDHRHGIWLTRWDDFEPLWGVDINDPTKFDLSRLGGEGPLSFTPQQYVGLKDKNGKEIFEGDILATRTFEDTLPINTLIKNKIITGEVAYLGSSFKIRNARGHWIYGCVSAVAEDVEVLGNIFEHSELLK